jgi:hypothetical protein
MTASPAEKYRSLLIIICLFVFAAVVSFVLSSSIGNRLFPVLDDNQDVWFDSDTRIVVMNMTVRDVHHWTLYKHPLFSIILWPLTSLVRLFVGDPVTAVRIVQAANAGLVVTLLFTLLARVGVGLLDRTLVSLLFVVSSTMLFWYTMPESFAFGGTTLLIALHAAISARPTTIRGYAALTLASIATLSMTITNWAAGLVATAVSFGLLDHPIRMIKGWFGNLRAFVLDVRGPIIVTVAAFVIAAGLAVVQDAIFGEASLFFNISQLLNERAFVGDYSVTHAVLRPFVLLFSPVVIGTIGTWFEGARMTADEFVPVAWTGLAALGLWILLLAGGLASSIAAFVRPQADNLSLRRMAVTSLITLVFFVLVHAVYGFIAFLYVAHTAPFVLAIASAAFLGRFRLLARIVIIPLILLAGFHNYTSFQQAVTFVHTTVPDHPYP